jgi:hypothetical protein
MIFNIVANAVIQECKKQFLQNDPIWQNIIDIMLFYSDDGDIAGENAN